ncbi:MAG: FIG00837993: hypothetical protein [uncultured Truepera sp.]|uniref:Phosphatidate phosphatase APP1 catalytic domain-containing protein n=1 Tax=uncultured Truepera sp. TaxID=543023 RepID=A0A6J4ULP9_9DEIN|nr:MAG: FIG00837993: hypothetical protein [uncultured Truepera sp.]
MSRWHKLIYQTETQFDRALEQAERLDGDDPLLIQSYLSYGVPGRALVLGRVLEDRGVAEAEQNDSLWENFKGAWKRFRSGEVRHAELSVSLETPSGTFQQRLRADDEGHIAQWLTLPEGPPDDDGLLTLRLELLEPKRTPPVRGEASVLIPPPTARFGVISDIDDTVLQTGATSVRSLAKQVLFGNAYTRLPFEGVAAFYEALNRGGNPLFYVSSSPWNLYDVLVEFMELNSIPLGPIMLRDWGVSATELLPTSHGLHKQEAIRQILETYPALPFILIGDSGQEDPEIYSQIVRDFPGRILSIYIRDVDDDAARRESVQKLAKDLAKDGSTLLLTANTAVAAEHAAAQGWIHVDGVAKVAERRDEDIAKPA